VEEFLNRLAGAPRRALLIDYDGTVAPLTSDRPHAEPYPGLRESLMRLAGGGTTVWVVSGRAVADLSRLVRLGAVAELWGSHGLERQTRDGARIAPAPARTADSRLDEALAVLQALGAGPITERKPYGVALHARGASPTLYRLAESVLRRHIADRALFDGLELQAFDGGVELRPLGAHKGQVVDRSFIELGPGAAVAYLGDDRTDEDAFEAVAGRGLAVLVRPEYRPTRAEAWLRPPGELLEFLEEWNVACCPPTP